MKKKGSIPALLIIGGPTASGKSALAEEIAMRKGFPIISADSRQIYRGFDIGTAKPTPEVQAKVRYEMIDILDPQEQFSAGKFAERAAQLIQGKYKKERVIIISGGTGFYISALMDGLAHIPKIRPDIQEKWNDLLELHGLEFLQSRVQALDPKYHRSGDLNNTHRLLRAIKIADQTGQSIMDFTPTPILSREHQTGFFAIRHDRKMLYKRINDRVDQMIKLGLVEEVQRLLPYRDSPAMNTVGYKEIVPYLEGKTSLAEAVEKIKQYSRNYAKRQLTWLNRSDRWNWIDLDNPAPIEEWIRNHE